MQRRHRLLVMKLLLLGFSTLLPVLLVELYLHRFDNYRGPATKIVDGKPVDVRGTSRAMYDYLAAGKDIYPCMYPAWVVKQAGDSADGLLPLGGLSRALSAFGNEVGEYVVYTADRYGFNNRDEVWDQAPEVMIVGCSFAQGAYVPRANSIASLLTSGFKPTVTLGMQGNGPLAGLAALREYGPSVKPKVVLLYYSEYNALATLDREMGLATLNRYLDPGFSQGLVAKQPQIDAYLRALVEAEPEYQAVVKAAKTASAFSSVIRFRNLRAKIGQLRKAKQVGEMLAEAQRAISPSAAYDLDDLQQVVGAARTLCSSWGGTLHVVYNVQSERYKVDGGENTQRDEVLALLRGMGVSVIDLAQLWKTVNEPLSYFTAMEGGGGHHTKEGYRMVAEFIAASLDKEVGSGL